MRLSLMAFLLAVPPAVWAADPAITGLSHDSASGKTRISWSNVDAKNGVVVYRSDRKLEGDELFFAKKFIFPAGSSEGEIIAKGSGKYFYRIAALTPYRRITGNLSAEKAVEEVDRSVPDSVAYTLERNGSNAMFKVCGKLSADAEKLLLLYRNDLQAPVKVLESVPAKNGNIALPENLKQGFSALAVADKSGNYMMPEKWFYCGKQPDFSINGSPLVSKNKDISLNDRFMTVGKSSNLSFTIRNNGGIAGSAQIVIKVTGKDGKSEELFRRNSGTVAAGGQKIISVNYTPQKAGKVELSLEIIAGNDVDKSNNQLKMPLYNLAKPLYIIWYAGKVMDLEYANYASVHADDRAEFIRRGGKHLATTGRLTGKSGEAYYKRIKSAGGAGMQLDEIGGNHKATKYLPAIIDLEKNHPELLSAVWHIGNSPQKEVIQALKDRKIDFIMPEIYYTDGTPAEQQKALKSLRAKLEKLRKTDVAEYMLIGLGTHHNYLGWEGSPDKHARFIEEQIKIVREVLPMTPGIAFYSSAADTKLLKQVDEMCKKYFLENER